MIVKTCCLIFSCDPFFWACVLLIILYWLIAINFLTYQATGPYYDWINLCPACYLLFEVRVYPINLFNLVIKIFSLFEICLIVKLFYVNFIIRVSMMRVCISVDCLWILYI